MKKLILLLFVLFSVQTFSQGYKAIWNKSGNYIFMPSGVDSLYVGYQSSFPLYQFAVNGTSYFNGGTFFNSYGTIAQSGYILNGSDSLVDANAVYDFVDRKSVV